MATPRRQENPQILRETELIDSYVWVWQVTFLYSIFLPVLVKATPCIGKDLGMCTMAYASLMVELQQDGYTSKTSRESPNFELNQEFLLHFLFNGQYYCCSPIIILHKYSEKDPTPTSKALWCQLIA